MLKNKTKLKNMSLKKKELNIDESPKLELI